MKQSFWKSANSQSTFISVIYQLLALVCSEERTCIMLPNSLKKTHLKGESSGKFVTSELLPDNPEIPE